MNGRMLCSVTFRRCLKPLRFHHISVPELSNRHRHMIGCPGVTLSSFAKDVSVLGSKNGTRLFVTNDDEYDSSDGELLTDSRDMGRFQTENTQKHILYPTSEDLILKRLVGCSSLQEVFDIISENHEHYECEHICQTSVVLWDVQKVYYKTQFGYNTDLIWNDHEMETNQLLKVYVSKRNGNPTFNILLDLVEQKYSKMDSDMLSCTFLFLSKIGLNIRQNKVMQSMFTLLKQRMTIPDFPLSAYSRFAVALRPYGEIWSYLVLINILHFLNKKTDGVVSSVEDFHLLTIVMRSCAHVISAETFRNYKNVVENLYITGKFVDAPPNTIIKVLSILNFLCCSYNNTDLMRKLLVELIGKEDSLKLSQVIYILKLIRNIMEPRDLMKPLIDTCAAYFKLIANAGCKIPPPLLTSCSAYLPHVKQQQFQSHIKNYVVNEMSTNINGAYSLQPLLKICPYAITNMFWMNYLKYLQKCESDIYRTILLNLASRYLNFSSSMNYSCRHYVFEKNMVQAISKFLLEGNAVLKVNHFVSLSAFVISFGIHSNCAQLPDYIYPKLLDTVCQFKPFECFLLSRSLRAAIEAKKKYLSPTFFEQYVALTNSLNLKLVQYLRENETLNLFDLNYAMRAFINLKGTREDQLYSLIISRYSKLTSEDFFSRAIRNTVYNLISTSCFLPDVIDKMIKYVCDNHNHITGDIMGKLIYLCYVFDYKPKEEFLKLVADAVTRDHEYFNGLNLIQASLGLSYFQFLPMQLIQHIFSVKFLETLDNEIKSCYLKETYPSRVRYNLMQLNRVVCLDVMEADVPWFHDKYCHQLIALSSKKRSHFYVDVLKNLVDLLGGEVFVNEQVTTPYGYVIDFLVRINECNQPILENKCSSGFKRIAIILETDEENKGQEGNFLRGALQLKKKHLEILNYEVLVISSSLWTSMFMSEEGAKRDYLKKALYANQIKT